MITQIQFDALAELCRLGERSKGRAGAIDVMVHGMGLSEAARKHDVHRANIRATVSSVHRAIALTHQAVTGEKA